jgi:O-antigen/teichoic acid export membrane protein
MSSLKTLAIRGAIWTIAGYGAGQLLRLGGNLVLTRLLEPKLFGLMTLVFVFITALHLFSDLGIGVSVIQNKRGDDPVFLNTAWTLQVVRGVFLWALRLVDCLACFPFL